MRVLFRCGHCRQKIETQAEAAGVVFACPACGSSVRVPRRDIGPDLTVGGFRILRLLGRGGMASVYLARQLSVDRKVALKVLDPRVRREPRTVRLFLNEIQLTAQLDHPQLVRAYEAGQDSGVLYMAMAYVPGESLHERVSRAGALAEREALTLAAGLARALQYAWEEHRLLHRDIKPSNVLLDTTGAPRLADLGLALSLRAPEGHPDGQRACGTINYASPEQLSGETLNDPRADMFGLAATLYTAVTGQIPFAADSVPESVQRREREKLAPPRRLNPALSEGCATLLHRWMALRLRHRPHSWSEALRDLDAVRNGTAPSAVPADASVIEGNRAS